MCGGNTTLNTLSVGSTTASTQNFGASLAALANLVQQLNTANEEIRIWVPATSNFGNQTSSIMIMYRLIMLGVRNLRIVWVDRDPDGPGRAWAKLQILILGLPNTPPAGAFPIGPASVYFSEVTGFNPPTVGLGITGGWDANSDGICGVLKTRNFCCLQPYQWQGASSGAGTNTMYVNGPDNPVEMNFPRNQEIGRKAYFVTPPALTQNDWQLFRQLYPRQAGCIETIDTFLSRGAIELLPVYFSPGRPIARFIDVFFNLISGIIYRNYTQGLRKPTVITMLAGSDPGDYEKLRMLLDGYLFNYRGTRINGDALPRRYDYLRDNGYFTAFKRVTLLGTDQLCTGLNIATSLTGGNCDVLVCAIRSEPKVVFDYVYSRTTLITILEGMSTASLVLNLGTPFLHLQSNQPANLYRLPPLLQDNTPFSNYCNARAQLLSATEDDWEDILNSASLGETYLPPPFLASFITNSTTPGSPLNTEFLQMKAFFSNLQNDKLLCGLFNILQVMT